MRLAQLTVALAAIVLAGCAASATSALPPSGTAGAPPAPRTEHRNFVPAGAPAATTATTAGTCWTSAITVADPSAYRCYDGANRILDPCFERSSRTVDCFTAPWARPIRLTLRDRLPAAAPLHVTHPWALQLANGARCVAATGVVTTVGGVAMIYRCAHGAAGAPTGTAALQQVPYAADGARRTTSVAVSVTWSMRS